MYPQPRRELKRELSDALARLPGLQGVLPGGDTDVKQRVLALVADLERSAPFKPDAPGAAESLLGEWSLVFASDGTVVTRAPPAQLLVQLASIPGLGLSNIQQQIDNPVPGGGSQGDILAGAGVSCSNGLSIGLGPFGTWQVRVKGHWLTTHQPGWRFSGGEARRARARGGGEEYSGTAGEEAPGLASEVAFDGFGIRLQGLFGLDLGTMLPEFSVSVPRRAPRAQANWRTTYCDGEWRVGRGVETGGVFLFKRKV